MGSVGAIDGTQGWGRNLWNMLADGGVWGVPRCGLMYRKDAANMKFILFDRMPWQEGMPMSREDLADYQNDDHEGITHLMAAIGVEVIDDSYGKLAVEL